MVSAISSARLISSTMGRRFDFTGSVMVMTACGPERPQIRRCTWARAGNAASSPNRETSGPVRRSAPCRGSPGAAARRRSPRRECRRAGPCRVARRQPMVDEQVRRQNVIHGLVSFRGAAGARIGRAFQPPVARTGWRRTSPCRPRFSRCSRGPFRAARWCRANSRAPCQLIGQPLVMECAASSTASCTFIPKSITFTSTSRTVLMMVGPPGVPSTRTACHPSVTMVGVMDESGRLRGCDGVGFALHQAESVGLAGLAAKSSISSLSRKPSPGMVTLAAVSVVQRVRDGHRVAFGVGDGVVRGLLGFVAALSALNLRTGGGLLRDRSIFAIFAM
jgi:hypothetical protein